MAHPLGERGAFRVIVSGTREPIGFDDEQQLDLLLAAWCTDGVLLGVGDCPTGVDAYVREWARRAGVELYVFAADWLTHGRAAGPIRNGVMVRWAAAAEHALLIAMPARSSMGTWSTVQLAANAGVPAVIAPKGGKPVVRAEVPAHG